MYILRFVAAAVVGSLLAGAPGLAQVKSDFELSRDVLQAERKLLVSENMGLTEAEGALFWPVYDQYARAEADRLP